MKIHVPSRHASKRYTNKRKKKEKGTKMKCKSRENEEKKRVKGIASKS